MQLDSSNMACVKGHAAREADFRQLDGTTRVASFSLATTAQRFNASTGKFEDVLRGDGEKDTQWHRITAWNGLADLVREQVEKGSLVEVKGMLRYREWDHATAKEVDGKPVKLRGCEIVAKDISVVLKRQRSDYQPPHTAADAPGYRQQAAPAADDYDIGDLGPPLDMDDSPASYAG